MNKKLKLKIDTVVEICDLIETFNVPSGKVTLEFDDGHVVSAVFGDGEDELKHDNVSWIARLYRKFANNKNI